MDIILNRRSVRKFDLTKQISEEDLLQLCRYAEAAPSARRQKGREYIMIDDKSLIEQLSTVSAGAAILKNCSAVLAVIGKNPDELLTPRMQVQDLSAATENILLGATAMGLGSCWIGIYPIEERTEACNRLLNLPNGTFTFSLVAIGYPKEDQAFYDASKLESSMIHHNRY